MLSFKTLIYWVILVTLFFSTRIFFINTGYGYESDSWNFALTVEKIISTNSYHISRAPGFPLLEFVLSQLHHISTHYEIADYIVYNLATLIITFLCVLALVRICVVLELDYRLPLLLFIMFPVIIRNSAITADYNWSLLFFLLSVLFLLRSQLYLSAVFIAISAGFRLQGILLLAPMIIYLWQQKTPVGVILKCIIVTVLLTWFFYAGPIMIGSYEIFSKPGEGYGLLHIRSFAGLIRFLMRVGREVLEFLGFFATIYIGYHIVKNSRRLLQIKLNSVDIFLIGAFLINFLFSLCKLGNLSEYAIFMLPSLIILLAKYATRKSFIIFSLLIVSSNFADIKLWVPVKQEYKMYIQGQTFKAYSKAERRKVFYQDFGLKTFPSPSLIVCELVWPTGGMYNKEHFTDFKIDILEPQNSSNIYKKVRLFRNTYLENSNIYSTYNVILNKTFLNHFIKNGYTLYVEQNVVYILKNFFDFDMSKIPHKVFTIDNNTTISYQR